MIKLYRIMQPFSKIIAILLLLANQHVLHAQHVPSPKEHYGFQIGDDYKLTTFDQTEAYYKKLAAASDRLKLIEIGRTEEDRPQYMLVISSPENIKNLEKYQSISQKMALAEGLDSAAAKALSKEGKAVVWIDGGLHATEVVGINQLIETAYNLLSRNDEETLRILDDVIILLINANPDGHALVADWYMKDEAVEKRNTNIPRLYQKYIGHDNNRDYYIANMKESWNMNRQLYIEWMPQVMYNHHQTAPPGAVLAGPPYRDPFNYVFDPLMVTGIDALGAAMYNRLNAENKPGFTRLTGSTFSTWYNGGLRTTSQYHNMIGLLTEIIGNPTPSSIPLIPDRLVPNGATPNPVKPQEWHFRQSIDYSLSLNYSVLDYAARHKDELLFNIYRMGKNSIERGSKDHWTLYPKYIDEIKKSYAKDKEQGKVKTEAASEGYYGAREQIPQQYYDAVLKNPEKRDPRAYIIPADQADFPTAVKFVNALLKTGITIHQADADFTIGDTAYPKHSYIVKADQAFRPHVLDMFEPQDYPNDFEYPGGPPIRPYDAAGWTLAYQMGVKFDRILDELDGSFRRIPAADLQQAPSHAFTPSKGGYLLSSASNNTFMAINDLLKGGIDVYRINESLNNLPQGSFYIPSKGNAILQRASEQYGIQAIPSDKRPSGSKALKASRIALFDYYGGSMPSGWVRWLMEQHHFAFEVIYPQDVDKGDLNKRFDAILFISGGIPDEKGLPERRWARIPDAKDVPAEYHHLLGTITMDKSIPQLKKFMEAGGDIITVGSSTSLAYHLDLPIKNALVIKDEQGVERELKNTEYYIPGSILKVKNNLDHAANYGMEEYADVVFNNSPVFTIDSDAQQRGVEILSWFDTDKPLRSGWAWGQDYLEGAATSFTAPVGKGKLYAFGPEITFRGQAHSTFKLLFNQLYSSDKK